MLGIGSSNAHYPRADSSNCIHILSVNSYPLDNRGDTLPQTNTHRRQTELHVARFHDVQQCRGDARTRATERMPQAQSRRR